MTSDPGDPGVPVHVVVMGVSGAGKTTVGRAIGDALRAEFIEGDDHHPPANVARMAAGLPLTDADRDPWLRTLAALLAERHARAISTVSACSALRRRYRDVLRSGLPAGSVYVIHLAGAEATLRERMEAREHFMPPDLLDSQLATLEPLDADETGVTIDVEVPVDHVVAAAIVAVRRWRLSIHGR